MYGEVGIGDGRTMGQDEFVHQGGVLVSRTNLTASKTVDSWVALILDVARPIRPGLRMAVAGRGRLLLRQHDAVPLVAHVADDRVNVDYEVTGQFRSPIPPIRADLARSFEPDAVGSSWNARWAHHFTTLLAQTAVGPLHTGRWAISPDTPQLQATRWARDRAQRWARLLLPAGHGSIDWFTSDAAQILPLRPLAGPGDGRVKFYRKQARDKILPPVLLWWISGLHCYVILDGHDRLVAAITEDQEPPLLALSTVSRQRTTQEIETAVTRYTVTVEAIQQQVRAGTPGSAEALAATTRHFAHNVHGIATSYGTTRAWPLTGGTTAWRHLAQTHAPALLAELAHTAPDDGDPAT